MPARRGLNTGPCNYGPTRTKYRPASQTREFVGESAFWNPRARCCHIEEFEGQTLSTKYAATTVTGGTAAILANQSNGVIRLQNSTTVQAESARLSWADALNINMSRRPILEAYVNIATLPAVANQRMLWGLTSAYNATLDSITTMAAFRLEGDGSLLIETDDGTLDNDDVPTGLTITAGEWNLYSVFVRDLATVEFWLNDNFITSKSMENLAANTVVQPFFINQKSAGAQQPDMQIDYVMASWDRF